MSIELKEILSFMYGQLSKDDFIDFLINDYDESNDLSYWLSLIYDQYHESMSFESFVDLSIKSFKPDFDGEVYVRYSRATVTHDDGEEMIVSLGELVDTINLRDISKFLSQSYGESLGIDLEPSEEKELVFAILSDGYYELPDRDCFENTVEISVDKLEPRDDSDYHLEEPS